MKWLQWLTFLQGLLAPFFGEAKDVIPVFFDQNTPCIQIDVGGQRFTAEIDLGRSLAGANLSKLPDHLLREGETDYHIYGIQGSQQKQREKIIEPVVIGKTSLAPLHALPESATKQMVTLAGSKSYRRERPSALVLGNQAFAGKRVLFDLANRAIVFLEDEEIDRDRLRTWCSTPYQQWTGPIAISASLEGKTGWFGLDTGATHNLLFERGDPNRPPHFTEPKMQQIAIAGETFSFPFPETNRAFHENLDGLIGMPFFLTRPILIDFSNQIVYFPSELARKAPLPIKK